MNGNFRKEILKILNNQVFQSILYSPFLDYHEWYLLKFVKNEAEKIKNTESILDIGAGELRYKKYFDHCKYISNDLCIGDKDWYFEKIDIKSTIYNIPVGNNSFDNILCTQALEHIEFPEEAFKEFHRILKKGGKLILSAPLGFGEHQIPHDYYRYTRYALINLGKRNHLKLISLDPHGGIFINLEYILWQSFSESTLFKKNLIFRYIIFIILLPVKLFSGIIFCALDLLDKNKRYTLNYNCIYKKL